MKKIELKMLFIIRIWAAIMHLFHGTSTCSFYLYLFYYMRCPPKIDIISQANILGNFCWNNLIEGEHENFIFQQDGAAPHWKKTVHAYLNENLLERWIGHSEDEDSFLIKWLPQSPDLFPCDFFLWGYVKGLVYNPTPLSASIDELKQRITSHTG